MCGDYRIMEARAPALPTQLLYPPVTRLTQSSSVHSQVEVAASSDSSNNGNEIGCFIDSGEVMFDRTLMSLLNYCKWARGMGPVF